MSRFVMRLVTLLAALLLAAPPASAVDPNFRVYDDQFVTDPFTIIQFGINVRVLAPATAGPALSTLTTQGFANAQQFEDATAWTFSPTVGTVADTVAQNVPATSAWTCNLPDRSDCGFDWAGVDGLLVADATDENNARVRGATAIEYDEATGRLMLRAAADKEGTSDELRLCFDPGQSRPDYPIVVFGNVDGARRFLKFGDTWATTPFNCLALGQQGSACGAAGYNRLALTTNAPAGVEGTLEGRVVNRGTVTLPSGHRLDSLLIRTIAEYDGHVLLVGNNCGGLNIGSTVRQMRLTWAVPYYGQVVTLTSPLQLASEAPSGWTNVDSTLITYGLLPPLAISLASAEATSLTVSWTPPAITRNIDGWIVHWGTQPGATVEPPNESALIPVGQTSYTIPGLTPSTTYHVSVTSVKAYQDPKSGVTTTYRSIELPNSVGADTNGDGVRDVSYPPEIAAATTAPPCVPGDIHPSGTGNDMVTLADFVLGRRKTLGLDPIVARDNSCGDLSPGTIACTPQAGPSSWCRTGNGSFGLDDTVVIRRFVAGVQVASCQACAGGQAQDATGEELRLPGDIAPRGNANGQVDVSDVVLALRLSVALDTPTAEELLRADVAPADPDGALTVVRGNGVVDVSDVVLLLRASVDLSELAWKRRFLAVNLADAVSYSGFLLRFAGWPASAANAGFEANPCGGGGGMDILGDAWTITCAPDPPPTGPREMAAFGYRSPEAIDPATLAFTSEVLDPALNTITPALTFSAR